MQLLRKKQGPYVVVKMKCVDSVDCEVKMTDQWKQWHIFHNIMLKKWHLLSVILFLVEEVHVDFNDVMTWKDQGNEDPLLQWVIHRHTDGRRMALHMCQLHRCLNAVTPADAYPMLRSQINWGKSNTHHPWFFMMPLAAPNYEETWAKTAFSTSFGLCLIQVIPFGLRGAPPTFQQTMDKLLCDIGDYAAAYLNYYDTSRWWNGSQVVHTLGMHVWLVWWQGTASYSCSNTLSK